MKRKGTLVLALVCVFCACAKGKIRQEIVRYEAGGQVMNGYLVYDEANRKRRPAVLVVHEWWGLNEFPKQRALELARLGYVAFCVDMFGNGAADLNVSDSDSAKFRREMDSIHADYVFKTYAGAAHAFTNPAATENGIKFNMPVRYDATADKKSWKHMRKFLKRVFKGQVVRGKL